MSGQAVPAVALLTLALIPPLVIHRYFPFPAPSGIRYVFLPFLALVFLLLPIHVVATFELLGLASSVSLLHVVFASAVATSGFVWLATRLRGSEVPLEKTSPVEIHKSTHHPITRPIMWIVLLTWLCFLFNRLTSFPLSPDALRYHLPLVVDWMQTGSFLLPETPDWERSLPANAELSMLPFLAAGLERLANVPNILAAGMLIAAIYCVSCRVARYRSSAAVVALVFASMPIVQYQATSCSVDLFAAAFVIAGLAFLLTRFDPPRPLEPKRWYVFAISLAGCAWGTAIGTKPTMYPYVFLIFGITCWLILTESSGGHRRATYVSLFCATALLSSFWFLRGWIQAGNPVFPIAVRFLGHEFFPGFEASAITPKDYYLNFVGSKMEWLVYPWVEDHVLTHDYGYGQGLGALWTTIVPLGICFGLFASKRRSLVCDPSLYRAILFCWLILIAVWFVGLRMMPRFGLPLMAASVILSLPLLDFLLEHGSLRLKRILVIAAVVASVSAFGPFHEFIGRVRSKAWSRSAIYEYPEIVNELPKGSVIWNPEHGPLNYPLAGESLSNRVLSDSSSDTPQGWPSAADKKIDYVAYRPSQGFSLESELLGRGGERIFAGRVGPTHYWEIWRLSNHLN